MRLKAYQMPKQYTTASNTQLTQQQLFYPEPHSLALTLHQWTGSIQTNDTPCFFMQAYC